MAHARKESQIRDACEAADLACLCELACSHRGLVTDELRCIAWPLLLGVTEQDQHEYKDWQHLPRHRDEDQVQLDVNRSFVYYPNNESDAALDKRKSELSEVIAAVLRHHSCLCYFQGYHDIVQVLLLVLGLSTAKPAAARLSLLRIRDFMLPTMTGALSQLHFMPAILKAADPQLHQHLAHTEPFFALAATLTLYAHDVQEYGDIARLFDFLLASEAVMVLYLYVAITLSRKKELLEIGPDEPEMLHFTLSKLPQPLDLESLIGSAQHLFNAHPPEKLSGRAWSRISINSVLKTARNAKQVERQTLHDGQVFFEKQAKEIKWQDVTKSMMARAQMLVRRYRRPALATAFAVFAAVLAFYLRRHGNATALAELHSTAIGMQQRVQATMRHLPAMLRC